LTVSENSIKFDLSIETQLKGKAMTDLDAIDRIEIEILTARGRTDEDDIYSVIGKVEWADPEPEADLGDLVY